MSTVTARRAAVHVGGAARVNWAHPLAQGLTRCLVPSGKDLVDLVTGNTMVATGAGMLPDETVHGAAVRSNSVAAANWWAVPLTTETKSKFGIFVAGSWRSWAATVTSNCLIHDQNTVTTGTLLGAVRNTAGAPRLGARIGDWLFGSTPTHNIPLNTPYTCALTNRGSWAQIFEYGREIGSGDVSGSPGSLTGEWRISRAGTLSTGSADFAYAVVLIWDRPLTDMEMALLDHDWRVVLDNGFDFRDWLKTPAASGGAYTLTADYGSFSLTGQSAGLIVARKLTAAVGSFSWTGQSASLVTARKLQAAQGSFTLTGQSATLTKTSGLTLLADYGAITLTGQSAGLIVARRLTADYGAFTLTGQSAGLLYSGAVASVVVSVQAVASGDKWQSTGVMETWHSVAGR